jgi:hypothetical protein
VERGARALAESMWGAAQAKTFFEIGEVNPHFGMAVKAARAALASIGSGAGDVREALEDICNPIGYLQRKADAEGTKLSSMAYSIANSKELLQQIARDALAALSTDTGSGG